MAEQDYTTAADGQADVDTVVAREIAMAAVVEASRLLLGASPSLATGRCVLCGRGDGEHHPGFVCADLRDAIKALDNTQPNAGGAKGRATFEKGRR